jgi:hypothetical protein
MQTSSTTVGKVLRENVIDFQSLVSENIVRAARSSLVTPDVAQNVRSSVPALNFDDASANSEHFEATLLSGIARAEELLDSGYYPSGLKFLIEM